MKIKRIPDEKPDPFETAMGETARYQDVSCKEIWDNIMVWGRPWYSMEVGMGVLKVMKYHEINGSRRYRLHLKVMFGPGNWPLRDRVVPCWYEVEI
jgi:hypothetical protein